jgi:hypothetical protein
MTSSSATEERQKDSAGKLQHILSAGEFLVRDGEQEQFEQLRADMIQEVAPAGALQTTIFNQLFYAAWSLRRLRITEAELARSGDALIDDKKKLDRLSRHQVRLERTFHRSLREIKLLQTNAAMAKICEQSASEPIPPMADAKEVAKQSQKLSAEALYDQVFHKMTRHDNAVFAKMNARSAHREAETNRGAA